MAVFTKTLRKHIFVHPGDQQNLQNAIKNSLLKDKKKYSDSFEGAMLDVSKIKVIGDRYLIVNGHFSMEVLADFQVFSPSIGMTLDAVINKVNRNHCGCVVMNLFNASLSLPEGSYLDPREGDACTFVVNQLVVDGDLMFMKGTLSSISHLEPKPEMILPEESTASYDIETPVKVKKEPEHPWSLTPKGNNNNQDDTSAMVNGDTGSTTITSPKKEKKSKEEKRAAKLNGSISNNNHEDEGRMEEVHSVRIKQEPVNDGYSDLVLANGDGRSRKKHKKKHKHKKDKNDSVDEFSSANFEVHKKIKGEPDAEDDQGFISLNKIKSEPITPQKHKHRKRKRSPSISEQQHTMNASGDHGSLTEDRKDFMPPAGSEADDSPRHPKKKHKSKHKKEHDDTGGGGIGSNIFGDVVVKTEPVTPQKKLKKSRHKTPDTV